MHGRITLNGNQEADKDMVDRDNRRWQRKTDGTVCSVLGSVKIHNHCAANEVCIKCMMMTTNLGVAEGIDTLLSGCLW